MARDYNKLMDQIDTYINNLTKEEVDDWLEKDLQLRKDEFCKEIQSFDRETLDNLLHLWKHLEEIMEMLDFLDNDILWNIVNILRDKHGR